MILVPAKVHCTGIFLRHPRLSKQQPANKLPASNNCIKQKRLNVDTPRVSTFNLDSGAFKQGENGNYTMLWGSNLNTLLSVVDAHKASRFSEFPSSGCHFNPQNSETHFSNFRVLSSCKSVNFRVKTVDEVGQFPSKCFPRGAEPLKSRGFRYQKSKIWLPAARVGGCYCMERPDGGGFCAGVC